MPGVSPHVAMNLAHKVHSFTCRWGGQEHSILMSGSRDWPNAESVRTLRFGSML